ncbi:hypothetical protein C465_03900 [Halorubrum distributum JCM 9100]|uniref:Uncharacterized protein n=6 Tax=Halorubrum distributum TaxID=29283 RepID=M0EWX8_9EURY|nr:MULTISPECIES: hypothetical protein [Halorubrum distributum group]ELZ36399.1 hypothetical protein C473_02158 [Halorubrum terrestre JCM 10247]ELZ51392.1 hypothetical protein C465_03900 [Halorubrum distributum JCM 9100]ELZ53120.1 hypothetical protein C466_11202 [Halorubrum distributum JCM 10118]EMA64112.1 hypothetical protein C470_02335 [Halorubrum litoreum JCM 13561]EMA72159.1 hypothetical protein C462_02879 [Halorubrum arcis JCM 13916]
MRTAALPPIVAAIVALAVSGIRRLSPILLESPVSLPSAEALSTYLVSAQFTAFLLVYGLLFGAALLAGLGDADVSATLTALATGASATASFLLGSAVVLWYLGPDRGPVATAVFALGASLGVGIQFAVVAYAGVSLGERRGEGPSPIVP